MYCLCYLVKYNTNLNQKDMIVKLLLLNSINFSKKNLNFSSLYFKFIIIFVDFILHDGLKSSLKSFALVSIYSSFSTKSLVFDFELID